MITRRALAALPAFAAASPVLARARPRPIVIAHRGASGERPEHTLAAYELAITQGADFIEPDLVPTKDGRLVARHENEISGTTDVASRSEFQGRRTTKVIDGEAVTGWFTEDFTLAELKTLRARERLPQLRPANTRFDGQETIPTFEEIAKLARARGVGVYPEMKHPTYFRSIGLGIEERLAEALKAAGLNSRGAKVFVQCFEAGALKTFARQSSARRVFLIGRADTTWDLGRPETFSEIATFAHGLGPEWPLVVPIEDGTLGAPAPLMTHARAAGLQVHPWTVRAENAFLPPALHRGVGPAAHGDASTLLKALFQAGVDGVFSDFPGLAARAAAEI